MINLIYAPVFIKQFNKFENDLKEEILEKIELFRDKKNHDLLKVHKLHGRFKDCYSFSVNYRIRIVFEWENNNKVAFLVVGDHDIYKN